MIRLKPAISLLFLVVSACSHHSVGGDSMRDEKLRRESKDRFVEEHAAYEIQHLPAGMSGPRVRLDEFAERQVLLREHGFDLQLELDDRWSVAPNSVYRTESRYRLLNQDEVTVASAESVYATQDLNGEGMGEWIIAMVDSQNPVFFIAEKHNWSTQRYIVMQKNPDAGAESWSVKYVDVPSRGNGFAPFDVDPELLWLHDRKLIFRMDGRLYAMPLDKLREVDSLAYSIG